MLFQATLAVLLISMATSASLPRRHGSHQEFFDTIPAPEQTPFVSYSLVLVLYGEEAVSNSSKPSVKSGLLSRSSTVHIPDDVNIPDDLWDKFQDMEIPEDFPDNLFNWLCEDYNMDTAAVEEILLKQVYCFPDGSCIDLDDVGNTCCPF